MKKIELLIVFGEKRELKMRKTFGKPKKKMKLEFLITGKMEKGSHNIFT